jgi:beta-glucosidase
MKIILGLLPLLSGVAWAKEPVAPVHPALWPQRLPALAPNAALEARIGKLLGEMTLEQKVGQLIQADIGSITPDDLLHYPLGSILNGGSSAPGNNEFASPSEWLTLADRFYEASMDASHGPHPSPTMWGTDAVHGHNNIVGATIFPHNVGLRAARDPELIREIGEQIVREYAGQMVIGLQGGPGSAQFLDSAHVIATAKHFVGDGGTGGRDQGEDPASEIELRDIHFAGYPPAVSGGVQAVMASFSSWQGIKLHGDRALLTDVLKQRQVRVARLGGTPGCRAPCRARVPRAAEECEPLVAAQAAATRTRCRQTIRAERSQHPARERHRCLDLLHTMKS